MTNDRPNPWGGYRLIGICIALAGALCSPAARAEYSPEDWARTRLDHVRTQKAQLLREYWDRLRTLAGEATEDQRVLRFFLVNLEYELAAEKNDMPEELQRSVAQIREGFNDYYLNNYLAFYDFLFVNMEGHVFYTLRKEADLNANLVQDRKGALAEVLAGRPAEETFVDFHEYGPSGEPAAFFVEPIRENGAQIGWLILRCSINRINTIFAWTRDLGITGETFLVNQHGYMLTESSFVSSSTILKQRLDDRNINPKFAEGKGHRVVTDYRGFTVLTSFEVLTFMDVHWLAVAKIDRDEVLTEHYMQHRWYYEDHLEEGFAAVQSSAPNAPKEAYAAPSVPLRVDMDELVRAEPGQWLETFGISTCTGLLGARPGHFAYLAHISPRDRVYGAQETDLIGQMVMRIKTFDVRPCEMREVTLTVVAPHLESLNAIVRAAVENGFLLSQIRVFYMPEAQSARVGYDCGSDRLDVAWEMGDSNEKRVDSMAQAVNFSDVVQSLMKDNRAAEPEVPYGDT